MKKKQHENDKDNILLRKDRNIINLLFKIAFFFCAFVLVIVTVMANMGGSYDALRESAEELAGELFGRRTAKIEKLVNMSFFPSVGLDIQGLRVFPYPDSRDVLVNIDKFKMYMSFWDVATQTPKFKVLYVENLQAKEGAIGARFFSAEKVFISHDQEMGTAQLIGKGKLGVHDWLLIVDMDVFGSVGSYSYGLGKDFPVKFKMADVEINTVVHKGGEFMKFGDFEISAQGQKMKGELAVSGLGEKLLKVRGSLLAGSGEGRIVPDLIFDFSGKKTKIIQNIKLESFPYNDLTGERSIFRFLGRVLDVVTYNENGTKIDGMLSFLDMYDFDLNVEVNGIKISGQDDSSVSFGIDKEGDVAKISSLEGIYKKGQFKLPPFVKALDSEGKAHLVLYDGDAVVKGLDVFGTDVAQRIFGSSDNVSVTCGIADIDGDAQGYKFGNGVIEASGRNIDFAGQYAYESGYFQVDSVHASEGTRLEYNDQGLSSEAKGGLSVVHPDYASKPVVFDRTVHDYIADAFKSSRMDHPCLKYIAAKPEPKPEPVKEEKDVKKAALPEGADGSRNSGKGLNAPEKKN